MKSLKILIFISIILSTFSCLLCQNQSYSTLFILPVTFLFCLIFLLSGIERRFNSITIGIIGILLWVRLVLIPLLGVFDYNYQIKCTDNSNTMNMAVLLCVYESIIVSFVTFLLSKKRVVTTYICQRELFGNRIVYILFIVFAIVIFGAIGKDMHLFEFAIKSIGQGERTEEGLSANILLVRQIISSGLLFLFFYIVDNFRRKYLKYRNLKYVIYSLFCAVLMVCIIVGERRTSQIYIAFSSCWLLIHLFPKFKSKILGTIVSAAIIVLVMMTVYKHFNAFLYDSYVEAVKHGDMESGFSASMFDAYFYGIGTIKKNIDFGNYVNLSILGCLYDLARCTFGLNFIVPRNMGLTSELYNLYLYGGEQTHGYLLSSVGYGYIYFGPILAPIFSCINVLALSFFEKKMKTARSIEMTYIWAFVFMRLGFGFLGSLPSLVSLITRYLFFNWSLYFVAKKINNK